MSQHDPQGAQSLYEQLPEEWQATLAQWGQPRYRAAQVFKWIHERGVADPQLMTDLPLALRERLAVEGLAPPLRVVEDQRSADGTRKLLVEMVDGARVETVLIPRGSVAAQDVYAPPVQEGVADEGPLPEVTQCVSSQVGCAMGCAFCASGIAGLKRHMTAAEIIAQVHLARRDIEGSARLSGVVFMGMGEPLHNYGAVHRALTLLNHPKGIGMGLRRVTVSTSGLVPEIARLGSDFGGQVRLAVSVHAADSATRTRIMPVNKRHPLPQLIDALRAYPMPPGRRMTIEYTLMDGINDSQDDARALHQVLGDLSAHVNLIPMNPVPGSVLRAPSDAAVDAFQTVLRDAGCVTYVRRRKGDDIAAACGQLALQGAKRKLRTFDPDAV